MDALGLTRTNEREKMYPFVITLTRWDAQLRERRMNVSKHEFDHIGEAFRHAANMLASAREADLSRKYKIAGVTQTEFVRPIFCKNGWMTEEEREKALKESQDLPAEEDEGDGS